MITTEPLRWAGALVLLAGYVGLCYSQRRRLPVAETFQADWLVVHASQTGSGEELAQQTLATLRTGGLCARSVSLDALDGDTLRQAQRVLFIASTYGEGDAPDAAARFASTHMGSSTPLDQLHYGLLALGDASYANFCGFGRALDGWLQAQGAQALFPRIDVDRLAPASIAAWQHHLSHLAGTSDLPDWGAPAYQDWRVAERTLLNPGSAGAPVYRVELVPQAGALPEWEAGDLVQISAPDDPAYPREYSIASLPDEGRIVLLVRLHIDADGSHGAASGWLCLGGDEVALRVRAHQRFRLGDNAQRPLILIGNGTGLAGLRAHLRQHAQENWLVFGERNAAHDLFFAADMAAWRAAGTRIDLAFSRDGAGPRYVQHVLAAQADALRESVARGAAIYVCGSLQGMASGVHDALVEALGGDTVEALAANGRYRRDVY
ncbi:MAG: sulfite reductase subunit alpha [Pseudomonadota bacterium]